MNAIRPVSDLHDCLDDIAQTVHETGRPVFLTKDGYGDMVLMSIELYEASQKKWNMYSDIELSEKQIKDGKTKDAKKALSAVREKYDL